jgi:hypothetical protein
MRGSLAIPFYVSVLACFGDNEVVDPTFEDPRARLTELRDGLLKLHTALLASERKVYERDVERIHSSRQFFELVLNDPAFAWLRTLSQFVVLIDEMLEAGDAPGVEDAKRLVGRARALLSPGDADGVFEKRYLEALQRDPDVIMAHSAMLSVLRSLE